MRRGKKEKKKERSVTDSVWTGFWFELWHILNRSLLQKKKKKKKKWKKERKKKYRQLRLQWIFRQIHICTGVQLQLNRENKRIWQGAIHVEILKRIKPDDAELDFSPFSDSCRLWLGWGCSALTPSEDDSVAVGSGPASARCRSLRSDWTGTSRSFRHEVARLHTTLPEKKRTRTQIWHLFCSLTDEIGETSSWVFFCFSFLSVNIYCYLKTTWMKILWEQVICQVSHWEYLKGITTWWWKKLVCQPGSFNSVCCVILIVWMCLHYDRYHNTP